MHKQNKQYWHRHCTRYNLIEYSDNYSTTSGIIWQYYKDEPGNTKDVKIIVPVKYLSNFWRNAVN